MRSITISKLKKGWQTFGSPFAPVSEMHSLWNNWWRLWITSTRFSSSGSGFSDVRPFSCFNLAWRSQCKWWKLWQNPGVNLKLFFVLNSCIKVMRGLSVAKDLANRWTDMLLHHKIAYFWWDIFTLPKEKNKTYFLLPLFKTQTERKGSTSPLYFPQ